MASKLANSLKKLSISKEVTAFLIILFLINIILFREMIFFGKAPVAFDFGVYNYQPWKLDFEESFIKEPKRIGHDDIRIFYPQRKFITDSLKKSVIPFWNPYEFVGNVALANSQTAIFYPPFLMFLMLPQVTAWSLLSFSIPIIAGLGTYAFLKLIISGKYGPAFGALTFAFSSTIVTRTQDGLVAGHSLIWLPWVLYFISKYSKTKNHLYLIVATISLAFSILAGWFQFTFYVFAIGFSYALYILYTKKHNNKSHQILTILVTFAFPILITAFHWLPSLEALRFSPRGVMGVPEEFTENHLMPITHLITLLIPNFFGHIGSNTYYGASEFKEGVLAIGIIPFLLAFSSFKRGEGNKSKKFFLSLFIISLLMGIKSPFSRGIISLNIPVVSTFLPNRVLSLASFSLAVLAGFSVYEIEKAKKEKIIKVLMGSLMFFFFLYFMVAGLYFYEKIILRIIKVYSFFEVGIERYIRLSLKESVIPFFALLAVYLIFIRVKKTKIKLALVTIFLVTISCQIYRANRYLYFSHTSHEFPQNPAISFLKENTKEDKSRFLSLTFSRITSNIPTYYELYFPEGVDALYPIWYGEFSDFFEGRDATLDNIPRIEISFSEEINRRRWLDPKTINLLSHLGVRYIITPKDDFHLIPPEPAFSKVFSHKWHTIYEYNYSFPRAYFVPNSTFSGDKIITLQRIFHPAFFDTPEVVLVNEYNQDFLQGKDPNSLLETNLDLVLKHRQNIEEIRDDPYVSAKQTLQTIENNPVNISELSNNKMVLQANIKEDGFIVTSDSYFPGWEADVDGKPVTIFRANHAFRAVPVTKGQHEIIFSYKPKTYTQGLKIALVSGFVFLLVILTRVINKYLLRLRR